MRLFGRHALIQAISIVLALFAFASGICGQASPIPELTKIQQIRLLTPEQAARKIPVRVRGVVTSYSGYKDSFFLQDATAGISVDQSTHSDQVSVGDFVEVEGVSAAGLFAPTIDSCHVHVLSTGKLPQAPLFRLSELTGGAQDSQWIALRGVVRSAELRRSRDRETLFLTLDTGQGLVTARVLDYEGDYRHLVDAMVLLQGVCGTIFNGHRQFVGVRMFIPSQREITVEQPGHVNPFDCPLRPLNGLFRFGEDKAPYHRIRVRGTVTYQGPGKEIYLQQGNLSLLINTESRKHVPLGTMVEAAGFASQGSYSPELQNVVFRIIAKGSVTEPLNTKASQLMEIRNFLPYVPYDGQLVRTQGKVDGLAETNNAHTLLLSDAGTVFSVKLRKDVADDPLQVLPGSVVQVTGICVANTNKNGEAESFQILARSPSDLRVLRRPPWWNTRYRFFILAVTLLLILAAFALIYWQRKRIGRQKQALISSARVFKRALDEVPLLALSLDREGRVTACNELLLKLLGRSAREVIGLDWRKHFVEEACSTPEAQLVDASFSHTLRTKHEERVRAGDGSLRLVSWFNAVIHDPSGNGASIIAFGEDISERKRTEEELSRAVAAAQAASQAKSEFLANMSHEIRTPMNAILGLTELVLQSELDTEQQENLSMVKSSADALLTIINDILDFSKVEAGKLALESIPFCLEDVLSKVIAPLSVQAANKGLRMSWSNDPQIPRYIMGDPGRLRQVLLNLLGNALKFTQAGEIRLQVEPECLTERGVELHFRVQDTGIGIPVKQQGEIFKAFSQADTSVTRQFGGTGLGLSICVRLVHLFGGRIWVESEPGVGSTFHFTAKFDLPAAPEAIVPLTDIQNMQLLMTGDNQIVQQTVAGLGSQMTVIESGETALKNHLLREARRVLLAEDNAVNQRLAVKLLEKQGHSVVVAQNGQEAVDAVEREEFDVVLMDVQMPVMGGFEATARIRNKEKDRGGHVKIFALTANAMSGDQEKCLKAGMDGYLEKPLKTDELYAVLA